MKKFVLVAISFSLSMTVYGQTHVLPAENTAADSAEFLSIEIITDTIFISQAIMQIDYRNKQTGKLLFRHQKSNNIMNNINDMFFIYDHSPEAMRNIPKLSPPSRYIIKVKPDE